MIAEGAAPLTEEEFFNRPASLSQPQFPASAFSREPDLVIPGKRSGIWWALGIVLVGGALGVGGWFLHGKLTSPDSDEPVAKAGVKTEPTAPKETPKEAPKETPKEAPKGTAGAEPEKPAEAAPEGTAKDAETDLAVTPLVPGEKESEVTKAPEKKPVEKKPVEKKPVERKPVEKKPIEKKPIEKKPVEKKPADKKPPVKVAAAGYSINLKKGEKLYRAGKLKAAAQSLEMAVEANPNGAAALVALANVYFEMDRNKQAVDMAKRALAINPKNARAHLTLGTIYQTMGNNGLAKKAYQQYLKLEPKGRFAPDVRSILKSLE